MSRPYIFMIEYGSGGKVLFNSLSKLKSFCHHTHDWKDAVHSAEMCVFVCVCVCVCVCAQHVFIDTNESTKHYVCHALPSKVHP